MPSSSPKEQDRIAINLVIGLSGLTSTGKSTISAALSGIFTLSSSPPSTNPRFTCSCSLIHQDEYYKPSAEIPSITLGEANVQDWDCADSIDWTALREAIVSSLAELGNEHQDAFESKIEHDFSGDFIRQKYLHVQKGFAQTLPPTGQRVDLRIIIVEGFLLFGRNVPHLMDYDARLLLRTRKDTARARRAARTGYDTDAGFWIDPPGYFDSVVWPAYECEHAYLFVDGDVEGRALDGDGDIEGRGFAGGVVVMDIDTVDGDDHGDGKASPKREQKGRREWTLEETCDWALKRIILVLEEKILRIG